MRLTKLGLFAAFAATSMVIASPGFAFQQRSGGFSAPQRSYSAPVQRQVAPVQRQVTPTYRPQIQQRQQYQARPQQNVVRPQQTTKTPQYGARPQQQVRTGQATTKQGVTTGQKQGLVSSPGKGQATPAVAKSFKEVKGGGLIAVNGRNYSVWKGAGPQRVFVSNRWRTFAALSALSVIVIGGYEYYPTAYLSAPENTCTGLTDDGCTLQYEAVETVDGPVESSCVAYCPR